MRGKFEPGKLFVESIEKVAANLYSVELDPSKVAASVRKISDFYLKNPSGKTPYQTAGALAAYLLYFTVLNHVRCLAVFQHARMMGFFHGLSSVIDWGSGMGAAWFALMETAPSSMTMSLAVERSDSAINTQNAMRKRLCPDLLSDSHFLGKSDRDAQAFLSSRALPARTLALFSYSLTELERLPRWALDCEALAIVEPGTNQDGRRLMTIRDELIEHGYTVWAPCTHQGNCPLLSQSKTDWCHDRIEWQQPEIYQAIEQHLPMRHKTLVFSYLLARKSLKPGEWVSGAARLTGDQQHQKGQTRQMFCRSDSREFLSWQHRHGIPPNFVRGEIVQVSPTAEKKGSDCRVGPEDVLRVDLAIKN